MTLGKPSESSAEERQPLLPDEDLRDQYQELSCTPNPYASLPVYTTIHRVRREVIASLDDPYSLDQLRAPRINVSVVRPLVNRFWDYRDVSIVYCLLLNRLQFLREQAFHAHHNINTTRAQLCELVALKILRRLDEETPGDEGLLLLSNSMVAGFGPFQNAPPEITKQIDYATSWAVRQQDGNERKSTALEVAIISDSRLLISTSSCQKVMDAIYVGRIVYTPSSFIDILPDRYKHKPITLYHPKEAPLLNQYRLMVPRTRNCLDIIQFLILLILYILVMQNRSYEKFTIYELVFCIYASGWVLDEFASVVEHGWHCYTQNLWSFLDSIFATIYVIYFILRFHSLATNDVAKSAAPALDILSAGAPVLIPRLAFNLLSENILFVSLRAMMANFTVLTLIAAWCFGGFLLSMTWLSGDNENAITISKWMLWVWFGLDGTGIDESVKFHRVIGPTLMITFAFLGNTLFLTILVSMLSSTFAKIASNVTQEIHFRRAVLTFEGVKSDYIFCYQPPFNILAVCFILPLKLVISPRWFHKVNVTVIRILNAPFLYAITTYERRHLWNEHAFLQGLEGSKKSPSLSYWLFELGKWWELSRFSIRGDTQLVFDLEPPPSVFGDLPKDIEVNKLEIGRPSSGLGGPSRKSSRGNLQQFKRKESFGTMTGLAEHITDFLHEHGSADLNQRLDGVEAASRRMEDMLVKISQNLGDSSSSDGESAVQIREGSR